MDIFNPDFKDFIRALNQYNVEYLLVGGYAVILKGYSRSTGYMDIWVNRTKNNFVKLEKALSEFGLPKEAVPETNFFSAHYDVFSFGRPPFAIEILTQLKGIESFEEAYSQSTIEDVEGLNVRLIHINHLIQAKKLREGIKTGTI